LVLPAKADTRTTNEPPVLVPPDERKAYLRFIAALQHQEEVAHAFAARQFPSPQDQPITAPLEIAKLEIKGIDPEVEQAGSAEDPVSREKLH
jgi:hypothetical protein